MEISIINRNSYNEGRYTSTIARKCDKIFERHAIKQVKELNKPTTQVVKYLDLAYQTLCRRL